MNGQNLMPPSSHSLTNRGMLAPDPPPLFLGEDSLFLDLDFVCLLALLCLLLGWGWDGWGRGFFFSLRSFVGWFIGVS